MCALYFEWQGTRLELLVHAFIHSFKTIQFNPDVRHFSLCPNGLSRKGAAVLSVLSEASWAGAQNDRASQCQLNPCMPVRTP
jgi:hypothetical protein